MAADLNTPTLPRRAILAGGASGLLVALPIEAAPVPDAELLRLGRAFEAAWAVENELWKAMPDDDSPAHRAAEDRACSAYERTKALVLAIQAVPASTLVGLRVKARATLWLDAWDAHQGAVEDEYDFSRPMKASIVRDLLKVGA